MIEWRSFFTIVGSAALASLCILPATRDLLLISLVAAGLRIADTLFHELGHAIFSWLFGSPSIPMIFTIFGADQAGGMAWTFDRSWFVQITVLVLLAYGCYRIREIWPRMFYLCTLLAIAISVLAFTRFHEVIPIFMGHGGAMLMGGFFLFRAIIYLDARNFFERLLNGLFGWFLILSNMYFCYEIRVTPEAFERYTNHVAFGTSHNDFVAMTHRIYQWNVETIALFGIIFGFLMIVAAFLAAMVLRDDFYQDIS